MSSGYDLSAGIGTVDVGSGVATSTTMSVMPKRRVTTPSNGTESVSGFIGIRRTERERLHRGLGYLKLRVPEVTELVR